MNIYVGNLSYQCMDEDLRSAFAAYGEVTSAKVISDKFTGQSRGFGFVEMANDNEGTAAINGLNGKDLDVTEPEIVQVITALAAGSLKEPQLAIWVRDHLTRRRP